jgi:polysaccharide biosynthesis PFTS motif protein
MNKKEISKLRNISRGYNHLKANGRLNLINEIKDDLTNFNFKNIEEKSSYLFFGSANSISQVVIKQYLISKIINYDFNKFLLITIGTKDSSFSYPIPKEWLKVIESKGIKVNYFKSFFLWNFFLIKNYILGILRFLNELKLSFSEIVNPKFQGVTSYVYFDTLVSGNIPNVESKFKSFDIISWYINWKKNKSHVNEICHSVKEVVVNFEKEGNKILYLPRALLPLKRFNQLFRFFSWGCKIIFFALLELFKGNWWHPLIFPETIYAGLVKNHKKNSLAKEYLFHNSSWLYRPLWTYEAEKLGTKIIFYFYSSNIESFKNFDGYGIQANSWQIVSWPNYLVWDEYQKTFIERISPFKKEVNVVGPIWFIDINKENIFIPENSVVVFDVQPQREFLYQRLGIEIEYYVPKVTNPFLLDVSEVISKNGSSMILKRKRNIGKKVHLEYKILVDKLAEEGIFIEINPDISAYSVIEKCKAVISMPFTSTALIAKSLGKPSIYYDPSGIIQKDDRAAHGITIITGIDELQSWVKSIIV